MKSKQVRELSILCTLVLVAAIFAPQVSAQTPDEYLDLLRQDVRGMKSEILEEALDL